MAQIERLIRPLLEAYDDGDYDRARKIGTMFERYPLGVGEILVARVLCSAEWKSGHAEEALVRASAIAEKFPQDIEALVIAADYARRLGKKQDSDDLLTKVNTIARDSNTDRKDPFIQLALGKAAIALGADPSRVLHSYFDPATDAAPGMADAWIAAGQVALDKRDFARAAKTYRAAVAKHPDNADILFGLAQSIGPTDPDGAREALKQCLDRQENHAGALLLLASYKIDEEDYEAATELAEEVLDTCADHPEAHAFLSAISQIRGRDEAAAEHRSAALERWAENPVVDHTIGLRLARKYRFEPAAEAQKRALDMDPDFAPAKIELAQNLLRTGDEAAAWTAVKEVRKEDPYSVLAFNLERLEKNLNKFTEVRVPGFLLRLPKVEAQVYGQDAADLLVEARQHLGEKYRHLPARDTIVEFFDKQQDFAVRTLGTPGGQGLLGACFGSVVTMNSPGGLGARKNNWKATLWHEMCHVITLGATRNRMPRWLSEGISVYEETLRDPTWGQQMTPAYRTFILEQDGLVPIDELSGAFSGSVDIGFAYYQSSLVVAFIVQEHGHDALLRVMNHMREGQTDEESLTTEFGNLSKLNKDFRKFAQAKALALGPNVDWTSPEESDLFDPETAMREKPNNRSLMLLNARAFADQSRWQELEGIARRLIQLYPEDTGPNNGYVLLARARAGQGDADGETEALRHIAEHSSEDLTTFRRLADLAFDAENWSDLAEFTSRAFAINPMLPRLHFLQGMAEENLEQPEKALSRFQSWLALGPNNPAQAHYHIGRLQIGEDDEAARRHLLDALSLAPRYRDAYREFRRLHEEPEAKELPKAPATVE